ncbi:amidase signature domain-containing protein [Hysterangium stoloniferum]|nr:amidase signature domain-containing protein [Hysterangium stoloniferum]
MALQTVSIKVFEQSQITSEVLQNTVSKINVKIRDHRIGDYTAALTEGQQAMETVMAMDDFVLEPDTTRFPRINMHYPTKEENKLDGWAWKVTVKNLNDDEVKNGPLYGRTVCLKDNVCLADVPCLNDTDVFSNWVPKTDATVVTRILEAGGIVLSAFAVSNTAAQGPIGNPYVPTRSAGGSSSGTGVLVATGQADMGIGGDQGGSIEEAMF